MGYYEDSNCYIAKKRDGAEFKYCPDCKQTLPQNLFYLQHHKHRNTFSLDHVCKKCNYQRRKKRGKYRWPELQLRSKKRQVDRLADSYMKQCIRQTTGIEYEYITEEMIVEKRKEIAKKRLKKINPDLYSKYFG